MNEIQKKWCETEISVEVRRYPNNRIWIFDQKRRNTCYNTNASPQQPNALIDEINNCLSQTPKNV